MAIKAVRRWHGSPATLNFQISFALGLRLGNARSDGSSRKCVGKHASIANVSTKVSTKEFCKELVRMNTVTWLTYQFTVYAAATTWNDVGGIYIFAGLNAQGRWRALYIGQAKSFKERLPNHENWSDAVALGATHIHAMSVPRVADRDRIEAELIAAYQPALNVQLK